jgi:multisubunit Na+/H+ antiporter MnhE subunit
MTDTKGASTGHLLFGVGWATTKLVNNAVSFQSHDYIVRTVYTLLLVYYYMAPICKATQTLPCSQLPVCSSSVPLTHAHA